MPRRFYRESWTPDIRGPISVFPDNVFDILSEREVTEGGISKKLFEIRPVKTAIGRGITVDEDWIKRWGYIADR